VEQQEPINIYAAAENPEEDHAEYLARCFLQDLAEDLAEDESEEPDDNPYAPAWYLHQLNAAAKTPLQDHDGSPQLLRPQHNFGTDSDDDCSDISDDRDYFDNFSDSEDDDNPVHTTESSPDKGEGENNSTQFSSDAEDEPPDNGDDFQNNAQFDTDQIIDFDEDRKKFLRLVRSRPKTNRRTELWN
jgi:hypothetical protein